MTGDDMLVPCTEDDIVPGRTYYMVNAMRPNHFYAQEFAPVVEWETIQMLIKYKRIWQLKVEVPE
jgi:hypothetical protein